MDPDEQLIFLNKRDECDTSSGVRLTKNFNPPIKFPPQGGSISVIECSLSNTFNKINDTNNTFTLQCQGTIGAPYEPFDNHTVTITEGNYTKASIASMINDLILPLDAIHPVRAKVVDAHGDTATKDPYYLRFYAQQRIICTFPEPLQSCLGFVGDETFTDGGGGVRYFTSTHPMNLDIFLPSTLYLRSNSLYNSIDSSVIISDRRNNLISIPCHDTEHNQAIFHTDQRLFDTTVQEMEYHRSSFRNTLRINSSASITSMDFYVTYDEDDVLLQSSRERFSLTLLIQKNNPQNYIRNMSDIVNTRIDLLLPRAAAGTTMKIYKQFNPPLRGVRSFQFLSNSFSNYFLRFGTHLNNNKILWGNAADELGVMKTITLPERHYGHVQDLAYEFVHQVAETRALGETHGVGLQGPTYTKDINIIINHNKTITIRCNYDFKLNVKTGANNTIGVFYKALGLPSPDDDGYITASVQGDGYYHINGNFAYQNSGEDSYYIKSDLNNALDHYTITAPQYGLIYKLNFDVNPGESLHHLDGSEFVYNMSRPTDIFSMTFELVDYNGIVQKKTDYDDWALSMMVTKSKF